MATGWRGLVESDGKFPYLFECPEINCYYRVVGISPEISQHKCPMYGETKIGWTVTKTLVEQIWQKLDNVMDTLMAGSADANAKLVAQTKARAYAEVLAIFMAPHFKSADEIAKESKRRWEARQSGVEYETAGLGSLRYSPPPETVTKAKDWYTAPDGGFTAQPSQAGIESPRSPSRASRTTQSRAKSLNVQEIEAIKFAHQSGMFTVDELAKTYSVNRQVIDQIVS